jgi:hypothetical protein
MDPDIPFMPNAPVDNTPAAPNMSQADLQKLTSSDPQIATGSDPAVAQSTAPIPGDATKTGFNPFNLTNDQANMVGTIGNMVGTIGKATSSKGMAEQSSSDQSSLNTIYSPQHMYTPEISSNNAINKNPALSVQPAALGNVSTANTAITPTNINLTQGPIASVASDRRAKTNITSAKRDVYSFLDYLNKVK